MKLLSCPPRFCASALQNGCTTTAVKKVNTKHASARARARAAQRRARLSPRIDDAYGELGLRRQDPAALRRVQELELQLRSPRAPGGHAAAPLLAPQP